MKIDLLMVDTFEDSELELEKKLHLFLEKTELENRRLQRKLKKMTSDYDVSVFQGFRKVCIY